jgi:hypothetical protein
MRWDKIQIAPVVNSDDTQSAKALWISLTEPSDAIVTACYLVALDLVHGRDLAAVVTLPPTFIQRERDSEFEFCPFGRVVQRGLTRSFADCAASGPVAW